MKMWQLFILVSIIFVAKAIGEIPALVGAVLCIVLAIIFGMVDK